MPSIGARRAPGVGLLGVGSSFGSFGEIVQGRRADGEDFLVTLPVDLWSRCRVDCTPIDGPSQVAAFQPKSRQVAMAMLRTLGLDEGLRLDIEIERGIPVGKGLSSSTADMLAVVRACEDLFGVGLSQETVSRLFADIEPHDALHYPTSVAYNHRRGRLLRNLGYVPDYQIVGVDRGGTVCTEAYNRSLSYPPELIIEYELLYRQVVAAFVARDDVLIARCAQRSTELHLRRTGNGFLRDLLDQSRGLDVLGILTTHSGSCGGLLAPGAAPPALADQLQAAMQPLGRVFHTRTLATDPAAIRLPRSVR